jgi:hypothetical protein
VGVELFHADGRTDMTNLRIAFRNFSNAPEKQRKVMSVFKKNMEVTNEPDRGMATAHSDAITV